MNTGQGDKTRGQGEGSAFRVQGSAEDAGPNQSAIRNPQSIIPAFSTRNSPDFRRILIIKPSAIGDVVHTLPILNLVRRRWPAAKISWVVTPSCAGLLEGHPLLDEVILFDRKRLGTVLTKPWRILELHRFVRGLRERKFDLVLDLQGLFRSGWMSWRTGSPVRVGFGNAREFAWFFYNRRVPIETMQQHAIDRYLKLAQFIGCDASPVEFVFATNDDDRRYAEGLLVRDGAPIGPYAVILPATNWPTKRWPIQYYAELVEPLRKEFGLATVLAGGRDAAALADAVPGVLNLAGQTTLRQLTALLEKASLVIANDSGPMHIAAALGRPLATMYGPTNPVRTGPFRRLDSVVFGEIECGPCYSRRCSHHSCLRQIGIEPVLEVARRQMAGIRGPNVPRNIALKVIRG